VTTDAPLARRLGTFDAVVIGLGAMIGAGVFSAFGPAAAAAGAGLLIGLALAAGVAYCNAVASAQLAAQYPSSGGTYVYGRERLGEWWGFLAGWCFVVGKTASCAAMALTFAVYAIPAGGWWSRGLAALAVCAVTAANLRGITRTAALSRILVSLAIVSLVVFVGAIVFSGEASTSHFHGVGSPQHGVHGVFQAAALLFFAFAGYARIATLGEEVRDPKRTIPRSIQIAFAVVVCLYLVVGAAALAAAGADRLAASSTPLATAAEAVGASWAQTVVRIGAAIASLGALLALVAGVGRTSFAMARNGDLPRPLASVDERFSVPDRAELAVGVIVVALVLATDLRGAIGFSSFGVLLYYAVANAAAFTQEREHRRWPRALNVVGAVACLVFVASLPGSSIVTGVVVVAIGVAGRAVVVELRRRRDARGRPTRAAPGELE
jgi:APA family basic amino acid/polyamine antiporter